MVIIMDIKQINEFLWEIKRDENIGMNVPVRVYANNKIMESMKKDRTLSQAMNAASLPGIVKNMLIMPDGHEGYGSPIGGVAAFDANNGIISPGFVGFDIGCGVRLIKTNLTLKEIKPNLSKIMDALFKNVPSGVGSKININITEKDLDNVARYGVEYLIEKDFAIDDDLDKIEEHGRIKDADPDHVSDLAKKRGLHQLGTLGAGNHFLELQIVEHIFDEKVAKIFGLFEGQVVIMLHSGSRGYGHQICSDSLRELVEYSKKENIELKDPELAYAKVGSKEAEKYWHSMNSAINFSFSNRQIMTYFIRKSFGDVLGKSWDSLGMELVYDLSHNIAKLEEHNVDGKKMKVYVHRKGATRAFGPGREEITKEYRSIGQPVLIPGSMGTASYILVGRKESMEETFGSSCHGAGRVMSRHQAIREIPASKTLGDMERRNIEVRVRSKKLISEEAEWAYKNVDDVVVSIAGAKISDIVAKMKPIGVTKG
jgi:tRNA-splicing ligase RtcB